MEMQAPGFWDDPEKSNQKMREAKSLKDVVDTMNNLYGQYDDIMTLIEMGYEDNDPAIIPDIEEELRQFKETFENIRISTLLSGEYDRNNAILKLNAGAGGTESCDWCSMLYRMYTRWAERKGYSLEVLDYLDGDEAGIKSVTFQINGENAYGYLKSEKGGHPLVAVGPGARWLTAPQPPAAGSGPARPVARLVEAAGRGRLRGARRAGRGAGPTPAPGGAAFRRPGTDRPGLRRFC